MRLWELLRLIPNVSVVVSAATGKHGDTGKSHPGYKSAQQTERACTLCPVDNNFSSEHLKTHKLTCLERFVLGGKEVNDASWQTDIFIEKYSGNVLECLS